jgi:hypothetical protein
MFKKSLAPLVIAAAALAPLLAVGPASAAVAPVGHLDGFSSVQSGVVKIDGWAYDGDQTSKAVDIAIYANGVGLAVLPTGQDRSDITALGQGGGHAISRFFQAPAAGRTQMCAYAIGVDAGGATDGVNTTLGCQTVFVRNGNTPVGNIDAVTVGRPGPTGISVSGWAYDPDAINAAVDVHVYVDPGTPAQTGTAFQPGTGGARGDVSAALGIGPNSGFDLTVPAGAGPHRVCVYVINLPGTPGTTKAFSCQRVTVPA